MQKARALATENEVGLHIHIAETKFEWDNIHNLYGTTPTRYLYDLGLLGPDVLGAHCIWLSDDDIQLLKDTGTSVAHNPECNMKVADGIAPITKMLDAGVVVSLGTDSCAVNDNMDMFEAMRVAAFLQKVNQLDAAAVSAYQVLEMATIGGARALGMDDEIGSLEVGKKADMILVDLSGSAHAADQQHCEQPGLLCQRFQRRGDGHRRWQRIWSKIANCFAFDEEEIIAEAEEYAIKRFAEAGLEISPYYVKAGFYADSGTTKGDGGHMKAKNALILENGEFIIQRKRDSPARAGRSGGQGRGLRHLRHRSEPLYRKNARRAGRSRSPSRWDTSCRAPSTPLARGCLTSLACESGTGSCLMAGCPAAIAAIAAAVTKTCA